MSYESVIKNTKKIESLLVEMGAEGKCIIPQRKKSIKNLNLIVIVG
jgi:hypothetical protein